MMATEEHPIITATQNNIIVLDACTEEYDKLARPLSNHFNMRRVALSDSDRLFHDAPPDALIIIVGKPHYPDVLRWLRHIRRIEAWRYTPIIPYLNLPEETVFLNAGATECWIYPIPYEAMIARLKKQLERVDLINDYRKRLDEYRQAYLDQSHLIEIASHDLQHPINDLLMIEGLLQQYSQSDSQIQALLEDMNSALGNMQETLNDFLTALYLRGQVQFKPLSLPVANILLDIGLKYVLRASNKNIRVSVGQTPGYIYAEPRRVGQIVENLVSNAVKYSPPDKEVHIWSEINPDGTYIRVRDWGPGIPEGERYLLFSEFGRLSTRPTGNESSIGLGLWVVKRLAQAMDGDVGVSFPDDGGSTFWVRLPSHPPA